MGAEVGIASLIMGVTFLGVFFSAHIVLLDQIDVVTDVAEERTAALPILEFVNLSTDDEALLDLASFSGSNWDTTADGPYDVEVNHATGSGGIVTITVASGIFTDMTVKVRIGIHFRRNHARSCRGRHHVERIGNQRPQFQCRSGALREPDPGRERARRGGRSRPHGRRRIKRPL